MLEQNDLQLTLLKNQSDIIEIISNDLLDPKIIKWYLIANVNCSVGEDKQTEPVQKYLRCANVTTLIEKDIADSVEAAILGVINSYDKTQAEGSNILFQKVDKLELRVAKYSPLKGSSYLPLSEWLNKPNKGLINIKNFNDEKCFLWSCLAGLDLPAPHPERISHYKHRQNELDMSDIKFPVKIKDIDKFEQKNPGISVSVFGLEEDKHIVPLRVSKVCKSTHINLLLLQEDDESHYMS